MSEYVFIMYIFNMTDTDRAKFFRAPELGDLILSVMDKYQNVRRKSKNVLVANGVISELKAKLIAGTNIKLMGLFTSRIVIRKPKRIKSINSEATSTRETKTVAFRTSRVLKNAINKTK